MRVRPFVLAAVSLCAAGCLDVRQPDLFLLTRTVPGQKLKLLVNDAGTIRCNSGPVRPLSGRMLLVARDLAASLDNDAKHHLQIPKTGRSVAAYQVKLQSGSISFPDTAGRSHPELAQAELFALQAAQGPCA